MLRSGSIPRSREHSVTLTVRSAGASVGVCTPPISTLSIVAPASAIAVQMMLTATLTARLSVPVVSRRMFFVSMVTRVRSPLMIGGNERTWSSSVDDQREEREVFDDLRVVPAFRVLLEDLVHRHLFGIIERDERPAPGRGDVVERGPDRVEVVDADRHLAPAPADRPVERLLQGHDALDRLVIERRPRG